MLSAYDFTTTQAQDVSRTRQTHLRHHTPICLHRFLHLGIDLLPHPGSRHEVKVHLLGFIPLTASFVLAIGLIHRWRKVQPHGLELSIHVFGRRKLQRIDFGMLVALIDVGICLFSLVITILLLVSAFGDKYYDETACAALGSCASMALWTTT